MGDRERYWEDRGENGGFDRGNDQPSIVAAEGCAGNGGRARVSYSVKYTDGS